MAGTSNSYLRLSLEPLAERSGNLVAAQPNEPGMMGGSRTNPRLRLIQQIRFPTTPALAQTTLAARPCSARRRIPTIPCGHHWPAMVSDWSTSGPISRGASQARRQPAKPIRRTPERFRSRWSGRRKWGRIPINARGGAVGEFHRRATERTQAAAQPDEPDVTLAAKRTQELFEFRDLGFDDAKLPAPFGYLPVPVRRGGGFPPYHAHDHGLPWLTNG
jgi:hypothetical protein